MSHKGKFGTLQLHKKKKKVFIACWTTSNTCDIKGAEQTEDLTNL